MTEALPPHNEELSLFLGAQGSRITHIVDAYARQAIAADRAVRAGDAPKQVEVEHRQGCDALGGYGHGVGPCSCGVGGAAPDGVWQEATPVAWQFAESFWSKFESVPVALRVGLRPLFAAPQPIRVDKGVEAAGGWSAGTEDGDGNPLVTVRVDALVALTEFALTPALLTIRVGDERVTRAELAHRLALVAGGGQP